MLFNSIQFLVFFPVVTLVYFLLPHRVRYIWLLVASYYFYMSWSVKYALLLAFSTLTTWVCGLAIQRAKQHGGSLRRQKLWIAASFTINLSILFFFKYFYFTVDSINRVLQLLHIRLLEPSFSILLPVGISFFIFQALGYTVDVYRGDVQVEKNPLRYALFVSFFPQLVAGPIERSSNLLPQLYEPHRFEYTRVKNGMLLMLWGLFKKIVIADRAAILVNEVFDNYPMYAGLQMVVAVLFFAVQIYCDFSGYTDIAIGAAGVMGFTLMQNFRQPYFARSIAEFWHRWHISLSTWFRDYLYIPLGGNRKGRLRKYLNLMITFLVSGLWHGASWTYVIWGGLNGAYQVAGDATATLREKAKKALRMRTQSFSYRLFQRLLTCLLVCVSWVFFRASSLSDALGFFRQMFSVFNPWILLDQSLYTLGLARFEFWLLVYAIAVLLWVDLYHERHPKVGSLRAGLAQQTVLFRWGAYVCVILVLLLFGIYGAGFSSTEFIYFQF